MASITIQDISIKPLYNPVTSCVNLCKNVCNCYLVKRLVQLIVLFDCDFKLIVIFFAPPLKK